MDSGDRVDHADHDGTAAMTAMAIHDSGSNGRRKYINDGNCHVDDSFFWFSATMITTTAITLLKAMIRIAIQNEDYDDIDDASHCDKK